jgi:aspartyl-tRNA(Asn)/glutamyl-tRNA(Gln) amidotransferase subunit A
VTSFSPTTLAGASALLDQGEISAVELAEAALRAIDEREPEIGAFITIRDGDTILAEAAGSDERRAIGATRGPLDGIPIGHKDIIQTAGIRTTAGSRILDGWIPDRDAVIVARLRAAGTVLVGKLKTYEFAHSATDNPYYGRTKNPLDLARVTGGSSSGSAAAVRAGFCLGATGTDTGGSIRIPASFTGVVGIKPTAGLVSLDGVIPTSWSLDSVGPLAATAAGAALLLDAMSGAATRDSDPAAPPRFRPRSSLAGVRVGVERGYFQSDLSDGIADAFDAAVGRMSELGAEILDVAVPAAEDSVPAEQAIVYPESTVAHEPWLEDRPDLLGSRVRKTLLTGYHFRAVDYVHAQQIRRVLFHQVEDALRLVDVIATPATPIVAPRYEEMAPDAAGASRLLRQFIRFLVTANLTGHPAVSVPAGTADFGMPFGLQLIGRRRADLELLSIAGAVASDGSGP